RSFSMRAALSTAATRSNSLTSSRCLAASCAAVVSASVDFNESRCSWSVRLWPSTASRSLSSDMTFSCDRRKESSVKPRAKKATATLTISIMTTSYSRNFAAGRHLRLRRQHHDALAVARGEQHSLTLDAAQLGGLEVGDHDDLLADQRRGLVARA